MQVTFGAMLLLLRVSFREEEEQEEIAAMPPEVCFIHLLS
jgi:hypothetical protein